MLRWDYIAIIVAIVIIAAAVMVSDHYQIYVSHHTGLGARTQDLLVKRNEPQTPGDPDQLANSNIDIPTGEKPDRDPTPEEQAMTPLFGARP
jgi:cell division protein FtsW (lipid II flippase)